MQPAGYQPTAMLRQPIICIQISDTGHIVNAALFSDSDQRFQARPTIRGPWKISQGDSATWMNF